MDAATTNKAATPTIEVTVNGKLTSTDATTLAALLAQMDFAGVRVATAVNGEFVSSASRADRRLSAGDSIEIVSARQGG